MESLARWTLLGTVAFGVIGWWQVNFLNWGCLIVAVLVVLAFWLVSRTIAGQDRVPGNPVHLAILGPLAVIGCHVAATSLGTQKLGIDALAGSLNASLLTQLFIVAAVVALSQSLLQVTGRLMICVAEIGLAIMCGVAAADCFGAPSEMRPALAMLGLTGIAFWLMPIQWLPKAVQIAPESAATHLHRRDAYMGLLGLAIIALVWFVTTWPFVGAVAAAACGVSLLAVSAKFPVGRRWTALVGAGLTGVGIAAMLFWRNPVGTWLAWPSSLTGMGEDAYGKLDLSARSSGLAVLAGMTGWTGLIWLPAGLVVTMIVNVVRADRNTRPLQAAAWLTAMILTAGALLGPCGLFAPVFTLVAGFVWGLAPQMLGVPVRPRSGLFLVLPVLGLSALMGLVHEGGLLNWSTNELGGNDKSLHIAAGLFMTLIFTWCLGRRRILRGAAMIVLSALVGGLGEVLQALLSSRSMDMEDWAFHVVGCVAAAVVYFLAYGSRLAESADADHRKRVMEKYVQMP